MIFLSSIYEIKEWQPEILYEEWSYGIYPPEQLAQIEIYFHRRGIRTWFLVDGELMTEIIISLN